MTPFQILVAFLLLCIHLTISGIIIIERKKLDTKLKKNLVAIYVLFLIIMIAFMANNLAWNFLTPELWLEKFVHVWINPIDMVSALLTAVIIRAVFGEMKLI